MLHVCIMLEFVVDVDVEITYVVNLSVVLLLLMIQFVLRVVFSVCSRYNCKLTMKPHMNVFYFISI